MITHALNCAIISCFKVLEVTLIHTPPKYTKKTQITVFLPEINTENDLHLRHFSFSHA